MLNVDDIKLIIRENSVLNDINSDIFGEVFTPEFLIQNMVDIIPDHIYKDPDTKILDNSVGKGNYTIFLIEKLLRWHSYEHIISNMLYFCDIQESSYLFMKEIFGDKINYHLGSFIESDFDSMMKTWNVNLFTLTIGNPPYNARKENKTNGNIIYDEFVIKSFDISDNICFVHPGLWRKPLDKNSNIKDIFSLFKESNLKYLNINSAKEGKKIFNRLTNFDWYYLEKNTIYNKTIINDIDGNEVEIDISDYKFLPNKNFELVKSHTGNNDLEVIFNSKYHAVRDYVSKDRSDIYKYPLIHSTPKNEIKYRYSSINNKGHFNIPKIIIGETSYVNYVIDELGEYGMTQGAMGIVFKNNEQKQRIINFLNSDVFSKILDSCMWSSYRIDANLIKLINF